MKFTGVAVLSGNPTSATLREADTAPFTFIHSLENDGVPIRCRSVFETSDVSVLVVGEIYNLSSVACRHQIIQFVDAAHLMEVLYALGKLEAELSKLEGEFFIQIYDKPRRQLQLITDKLGLVPIFYAHKGSQFIWSNKLSEVAALLPAPKLDVSAIRCFIELEYILGNRTLFEDIRIIEPASVITLDFQGGENVRERRYWTWDDIPKLPVTFNHAVDLAAEHFLKSVEKRFNEQERIGVSLSGGLDSRLIVAAINRLFPKYRGFAYTFGQRGCMDNEIAMTVAKRAGWQHKFYTLEQDDWFLKRLPSIFKTNGMKSILHLHGVEFMQDIRQYMSVNMNGFLGDVVMGGSYLKENFLNQRITNESALAYYGDQRYLVDELSSFYHGASPDSHMIANRGRRFVNQGLLAIHDLVQQRRPFIDPPLLELLYGVPDDYRFKHRLYKAMALKHFPNFFKDIPWQNTGLVLSYHNTNLGRIMVKKNNLAYKLGIKRDNRNYENYKGWMQDSRIADMINNLFEGQDWEYQSQLRDIAFVKGEKTILSDYKRAAVLFTVGTYLRKETWLYFTPMHT